MNVVNENQPLVTHKDQIVDFYESWYPGLVVFAQQFIQEQAIAEDVVQNAFVKLYEKFSSGESVNYIKTYLYSTIRNECLNLIKRDKAKERYVREQKSKIFSNEYFVDRVIEEEVLSLISQALETLPSQCQKVMLLSVSGLKVKEISEDLNISVNTVKTHKLKAYRILREKLKDLYTILFYLGGM